MIYRILDITDCINHFEAADKDDALAQYKANVGDKEIVTCKRISESGARFEQQHCSAVAWY